MLDASPRNAHVPGPFDVLVVGGGINGTGIARDAAGRGFRVALAEQGDLASGTSSASSKLVHGGLRYLEHGAFRLVREALTEREILLRAAPHIVRPLRFVLPHAPGMRPAWMLGLGLRLYDRLGARRVLPGSKCIDLARHPAGEPLARHGGTAFTYSDCWVEDARLVILNALDAARHGATVTTRTRVAMLEARAGGWHATLEDRRSGATRTIEARAVVDAAGPWAGTLGAAGARRPRLVKGSHVVVPRLFEHDHAYVLQNADGRIVFAIPFEGAFTLIGTTDVDHPDPPGPVDASPEEVAYLCEVARHWFTRAVTPEDVVHSFAGLRALDARPDGQASRASRDYHLSLAREDGSPILRIVGGKITTYRRLAEQAVNRIGDALDRRRPPCTGEAVLPGGNVPADGIGALATQLLARHPRLGPAAANRLAHTYGSECTDMLGDEPGGEVAPGVFEAELRHARQHEWVETADDFLWRRTRLGLTCDSADREAIERWLESHPRPTRKGALSYPA